MTATVVSFETREVFRPTEEYVRAFYNRKYLAENPPSDEFKKERKELLRELREFGV